MAPPEGKVSRLSRSRYTTLLAYGVLRFNVRLPSPPPPPPSPAIVSKSGPSRPGARRNQGFTPKTKNDACGDPGPWRAGAGGAGPGGGGGGGGRGPGGGGAGGAAGGGGEL